MKIKNYLFLSLLIPVLLCLNNKEFSQNNCTTPIAISSLPYSGTRSTCGAGSDYSQGQACLDANFAGEDVVYTFTPSRNMCVNTTVSHGGFSCAAPYCCVGVPSAACATGCTSMSSSCCPAVCTCFACGSNLPPPESMGLAVLNGCPSSGGTCVDGRQYTTLLQAGVNATAGLYYTQLTAGTTYYIIVDEKSTKCHTYTFTMAEVICPNPTSDCGDNLDFEFKNFTNWTGGTGWCCPITIPNAGLVYTLGVNDPLEGDCPPGFLSCVDWTWPCSAAQHTVTSGPATDPYSGNVVKEVSPNGGYFSARVGNADICAKAAQLCKNFTVTTQNTGFTYMYSVIFEDPSHTTTNQPRFQVEVKDLSGNMLPCGNFYFISGAGIPGFQNAASYNNSMNVRFKDWTYVGMDLSGYVGQTLSICFATGDCSQAGHFGYAYVDVTCRPVIPQGFTICTTGSPVQLCAPPGYSGWTSSTAALTECINVANPTPGAIYSVTAMSVNGCPSVARDTIKLFQADAWGTQTITCNGSVTLHTSSNDYANYSWSSNPPGFMSTDPNPVVSPLVTTTYYVNITPRFSTGGCIINKQMVVTVNPCFDVRINPSTICRGNCTTLTATISGGTAPFTYTWSSGQNGVGPITVCPITTTVYTVTARDNIGLTATATATITVNQLPPVASTNTAICPGAVGTLCASNATTYTWNTSQQSSCITASPGTNTTYTVTGTDGNGCTNTAQGVITVNPVPTVTASGASICPLAVATISAGGASSYTWNNGLGTGQTKTVNPATNTTYIVTGADVNGCTNTASCVATLYPSPTITATGSTVCMGTSTMVTASGGTNYTWDNGLGTGQPKTVAPSVNTTYFVTGVDANGCTGTASCTVVVNNTITPFVNNPSICNGICVTLTVTGGDNFTWSPGGQNTQSISVCPATTTVYNLSVTNVFGCTGTAIATVTVNPLPNVTATGGAICLGANISISANGAGAGTYLWDNGLGTGQTKVVTPNITTTYNVTGTDANGCTGTASCIVTVNPLPTVTATGGVICKGGSFLITASGANTYVWSNGPNGASQNVSPTVTTTYYVTGTDGIGCTGTAFCVVTVNNTLTLTTTGAEICNGFSATISVSGGGTYEWDNGFQGASQVVTPVVTTTYYVTGFDIATGCTGTSFAVVTVNQLPSVSVTGKTICYGASTTLTANPSGGSGTYSSYVWTPGPLNGQTVNINPVVNTTYNVTLTDSKGCTATTTVSVIVSPQLFASITKTDATCGLPNASAQVSGSGGIPIPTGPPYYTYLWSPGNYNTDIINNILSGPYTVTVTDAIGCTVTASTTILDTPPVTLSTSQTPTNCFPTGTATVNVLTGTPPYTYTWSTVPPQNTQVAMNIDSGPYNVTVIDSHGCSNISSVIVLVNNPLSITTSTTPEHCGQMDGTATANPAGGNPNLGPYTYLWDNGQTTKTIIDLAQGSYCVTASYGTCKTSGCATVIEKLGPNADFTFTPTVLDILENTTALFDDLSTPGGQPIVQWHWTFDDEENPTSDIQRPTHTYRSVGTYTVCLRVIDSQNCADSICKPIIVKDIFTVYIPNAFSPNENSLNDGFIPQGYRIDPSGFSMMIFNRWGEIIYKTNSMDKPWNGRFMNTGEYVQVGVYVYRVVVKELGDGPEHEYIGRVTLVR
ncbi:MAG: gliding motility-associated C-terminal domain-containing protein [Bacteroidales bacterium]|nr:gliding motility-associated C-terminal domain-containing protein [Bacteroidales bacterium]